MAPAFLVCKVLYPRNSDILEEKHELLISSLYCSPKIQNEANSEI